MTTAPAVRDTPGAGHRSGATTLGAIVIGIMLPGVAPPIVAAQEVWRDARNDNQTWFTGSHLPRYLSARLVGLSPDECEQRVVVFEAYSDGQASPDDEWGRVAGDRNPVRPELARARLPQLLTWH